MKFIYIETSDHSNNQLGIVCSKGFKSLNQAKKFRKKQIQDCFFFADPIDESQDLSKSSDDMHYSFGGYEFSIYPATNLTIGLLNDSM